MISIYLLIASAFLLPFLLFLLLPLWREQRTEGFWMLLPFAMFFWLVAIASTLFYGLAKYVFNHIDANFLIYYAFTICMGILILAVWTILKNRRNKV